MKTFYSQEAYRADGSRHLFKSWGMKEVDNPQNADLIVFNGGEDIGTEIYGEVPVFRGIPWHKSARDLLEIGIYNEYKDSGKLILGICRGAQLLNCLNGGSLWQHVDQHGHNHWMVDLPTGRTYEVTSTHHQMMRPNLETGKVIGLASESNNKHADHVHETFKPTRGKNLTSASADVEIVYYENHNTLCVQGHPEYVPGSPFANYVKDMVFGYIKKEAA